MKNKDILSLIGVFLGGYILGRLLSKKSSKDDQFSSAEGMNVVQFTIANKNEKSVTIPLFNAFASPNQSIKKGIVVSGNLNYFTNSISSRPKQVVSIQIIAQNQQQALMPLTVYCRDANGETKSETLIPLPPVNQVNPNMSYLQPNNLVLDGTCVVGLTLGAKQRVSLILNYSEVDTSPSKMKKREEKKK